MAGLRTTSFNLDPELHERFKFLCHIRGTRIGKELVRLVTEELDRSREEIVEYNAKATLHKRIDGMTIEQAKEARKKWK